MWNPITEPLSYTSAFRVMGFAVIMIFIMCSWDSYVFQDHRLVSMEVVVRCSMYEVV